MKKTHKYKRDGPVQNIEGNIDPSMADMAEVIGCYSTNIHAHLPFSFGSKHLLLPADCVLQPQLRKFWTLPFTTYPNRRLRVAWSTHATNSPFGLEQAMKTVGSELNRPSGVGDWEQGSVELEQSAHLALSVTERFLRETLLALYLQINKRAILFGLSKALPPFHNFYFIFSYILPNPNFIRVISHLSIFLLKIVNTRFYFCLLLFLKNACHSVLFIIKFLL